MLLVLVELLRTAWMSDDAAITLRTVLNFIHGYGPTFNLDERVQAYTHPLWFLLISALSVLMGNVFYATFFLSITISLLVYWLLIRRVASVWWMGLLAASLLMLSKAYVDYSTSGLENPLSHLMLTLLVLSGVQAVQNPASRHAILTMTLCASLYLVRPDLILVGLPLYVLLLWKTFQTQTLSKTFRLVILTGIPVILWTLFSLFYYGFPFPNTAYAKLGAGIPLLERVIQGASYLFESLTKDPITLTTIIIGTTIGLFNQGIAKALAIGNILYLIYIISIGGDFMSGRLLTPILLVSVALWLMLVFDFSYRKMTGILLFGLGIFNINSTLLSKLSFEDKNNIDIADERGFYFQQHGLLNASPETFSTPDWRLTKQRVKTTCGGLGYLSIEAGASAHIIDTCGLADPLLARLPAQYVKKWRIGHFARLLPINYKESIYQNKSLLTDMPLNTYYSTIRNITRAPLLDMTRLRDIMRINLHLVETPDLSHYRFMKDLPLVLDSAELLSKTGVVKGGSFMATAGIDLADFITYGPYQALNSGIYSLEIYYKSSAPKNQPIGKWDIIVWNSNEPKVLQEVGLTGSDNQTNKIATQLIIPADAPPENLYEFRNWWDGKADMQIFRIELKRQPDP